MSNLVYVVGLGPGNARFLTAQAQAALQAAAADDEARHRDDSHPEHHLGRVSQHLAKDAARLLSVQSVKAACQKPDKVIKHPA